MFAIKIENQYLLQNFNKYFELKVHYIDYDFATGEFVHNTNVTMERCKKAHFDNKNE